LGVPPPLEPPAHHSRTPGDSGLWECGTLVLRTKVQVKVKEKKKNRKEIHFEILMEKKEKEHT
jgi:hypothetical protein